MRRRQLAIRACTVAVTIAIAAAGMRMVTKNEVSECSVTYIAMEQVEMSDLPLTAIQMQSVSNVTKDASLLEAADDSLNIAEINNQQEIQLEISDDNSTEEVPLKETGVIDVAAQTEIMPLVSVTAVEPQYESNNLVAIANDAASSALGTASLVLSDSALAITAPEVTTTMTAGASLSGITSIEEDAVASEVETAKETIAQEDIEVSEEPEEKSEYSDLVIAQVNDYVNVRDIPSTDGEIVGKLYDNSVGTLVSETEDGWYEITSGKVTGYVNSEYCVVGEDAEALVEEVGIRIATVKTESLRVRTEADIESSVLGLVPIEEELTVLEEVDGWVKISIEEGDGYVSTDYVDLRTDFVTAESKADEEARLAKEAEARRKARAAAEAQTAINTTVTDSNSTTVVPTISGDNAMGVSVAQYACQFVGNPYVYGGSSLTNGTDCSGFVMSVYSNFGVTLPHSSTSDRTQGSAVETLEAAQPGDLICYSGHVALYIGNGQIVHASSKRTGIIISDATYKKILAIRRIF